MRSPGAHSPTSALSEGSPRALLPDADRGQADPRAERLAAFVPRFVRRLLLERLPAELRCWERRAAVACLFADVSGFTPLVEALAGRGKEGLEQLRAVMIRIFEPLVRVAERCGGDVLRFAGDAMTVVFPSDSGLATALADAAACALELQGAMHEGIGRLPRGLPAVGLKVGLGAGPATLALVGAQAMALAVDGPALERAIAAEHGLARGEIGVHLSEDAGIDWSGLPGETIDGRVWKLASAEQLRWLRERAALAAGAAALPAGAAGDLAGFPAAAGVQPLPDLERLAPFVLEPLFQRIRAGSTDLLYEHRKLRVIFFNFAGLSLARLEDLPRLDRFYVEAHAAVRRHGGFVSELDMGDKGSNLVALFGAPVAIEMPWKAAGQAALELVRLSRDHGLTSKAGLSCGGVFCGEQGAPGLRLQYGVFGEAINRAARLMGKAAAGEVLVDPFFAAEAEGSFELHLLPPVPLKGFTKPVVLARLGPAREAQGPGLAEPLLGRVQEWERLRARWQAAVAGHGGVVVLSGPPGSGRSRLGDELARSAATEGALVLVGRGRPEAQGVPLEAAREALEVLLRRSGVAEESLVAGQAAAEKARRAPLLPRLLELAPGGAAAAERDPAVALQSALAVVDRLVDEQARKQPILLVLEELQWIDAASIELLRDQRLGAERRRELLVLTARSAPPWAEQERELIELAPLPEAETVAVVLHHLGAQMLDRELEQLVLRLGHGNPLMLRELCRHLQSAGLVEVSPYGQAYLTRAVGEELPGSLEALMLARFDRLSVETRRLLQIACCLGTDFGLELLARIAGSDEAEAARLLQSAAAAGMLIESGGRRWSFTPPLLREVVHGALSREDRRRLHGVTAEALEEWLAAGVPVQPARLAYHYELADRKKPAYRYSCAAASEAQSQGAMPEALLHLDRAVELLRASSLRAERRELPGLLERRAEIHLVLGNQDRAAADARRLGRLVSRTKDAELKARSWLLLGRAQMTQGQYLQAMRAARKALATGRERAQTALMMEALLELGQSAIIQGRFQQAGSWLQEGLRLATDIAQPGLVAKIHFQLGRLYARTSEPDQARYHFERALESFEREGHLNGKLRCFEGLAFISLPQDPEQSSRRAAMALELSRRIGSRTGEATALEFLARVSMFQGSLDEAERLYRQSIATFHRAGDVGGIATCTNNLAMLLHLRQRLHEAEPLYLEAVEMWQRSGNLPLVCIAVNNLAELYEDRGKPKAAVETYRRALQMAREMKNPEIEAKALLGLARFDLAERRAEEAQERALAAREAAERAGLRELQAQADELLQRIRSES